MAAALKPGLLRLGDLLGPTAGAHANLEIRDLVLDSRQVGPGAAFVALPGGLGTDNFFCYSDFAV